MSRTSITSRSPCAWDKAEDQSARQRGGEQPGTVWGAHLDLTGFHRGRNGHSELFGGGRERTMKLSKHERRGRAIARVLASDHSSLKT